MRKNQNRQATEKTDAMAEQSALPEQQTLADQPAPEPAMKIENNQLISMLNMLHAAMGRGESAVSVDSATMEMLLVEVMLSRMNGTPTVASNPELAAQ